MDPLILSPFGRPVITCYRKIAQGRQQCSAYPLLKNERMKLSISPFAPTALHQQPSQKPSGTYTVPPTGINISPTMERNPPGCSSGVKTGGVPGTLTTAAIMARQSATVTASVAKSHAPSTPLNSGLPSHLTPTAKPPSATLSSSQNKGLTEEAKNQLERWLLEHKSHPYPNRDEKDEMMIRLSITDARKLEGWFCRARKRLNTNRKPLADLPEVFVPLADLPEV